MTDPQTQPETGRLDLTFSVPFVHRLCFTEDVLGADQAALLDVLQPSGERPPRVQFWLDEHLVNARPDLPDQLEVFAEAHAERFRQVGPVYLVPGGEAVKNDIRGIEGILRAINDDDLDRRSYIVVIGGGAVLDAVGFAAAIAHRGIRLVRLPTTTLAQGDSGVGVKNGVNLFGKKNWLGAFAVPWAVINDSALLATLPDRDFRCGFSEAVKVSLLKDAEVFDDLCRLAVRIRERDMNAATPMIRASVEMHLAHITQGGDPFEALEARPLDFGHWSAHKLEALTNFRIRHGEAVAIGVAVDAVYSSMVLGLSEDDAHRILNCLSELGFHLNDPALSDIETLFDGLEEFRQHLGGRLTLTMLQGIGRPVDVHEVNRDRMIEAIQRVRAFGGALNGFETARLNSQQAQPGVSTCGRPIVARSTSGRLT